MRLLSYRFSNPRYIYGGGDRDRTCDLLLAKQPLSQLSYTPILKHSCSPYLLRDQSKVLLLRTCVQFRMLQYGAQGETRTRKIWLLRPTRIPIPSPGQCSTSSGGNYSTKRYDAIIPFTRTFHPLPNKDCSRVANGLLVKRLPPLSDELTSLRTGHTIQALPRRVLEWLVPL